MNNKRVKAPLNSDFFKVAHTYARARGATSADARRFERLKAIFKTDLPARWPPPMETAFSLLYTAKDFPEIYTSRPGPKPDPGERRELEDFLSLLFDVLNALDQDGGKQTGYDRLATVLESDDVLISLNYDTMLDSALIRRGWSPKTGYRLGGGANKVRWNPPTTVRGENATGVALLKLHGSLNWWVRGSASSLSNVFSMKPVLVTAPRRNDIAGSLRQIIPPIYGKVFAHDHWRRLWKAAFDGLCKAQTLVVIGCSIVDTDYHLQALLRRVAKERKRQGDLFNEVSLVDRVTIRRRWHKILKGAAARYTHYKTFEAFLANGVHA